MTYRELKSIFCDQNNKDIKVKLRGRITFTEDSFKKKYPLGERTYAISNDNKAYIAGMGGYSVFGASLEGNDFCRLDGYMADEGIKGGWKTEDCYLEIDGKKITSSKEARKLLDL